MSKIEDKFRDTLNALVQGNSLEQGVINPHGDYRTEPSVRYFSKYDDKVMYGRADFKMNGWYIETKMTTLNMFKGKGECDKYVYDRIRLMKCDESLTDLACKLEYRRNNQHYKTLWNLSFNNSIYQQIMKARALWEIDPNMKGYVIAVGDDSFEEYSDTAKRRLWKYGHIRVVPLSSAIPFLVNKGRDDKAYHEANELPELTSELELTDSDKLPEVDLDFKNWKPLVLENDFKHGFEWKSKPLIVVNKSCW